MKLRASAGLCNRIQHSSCRKRFLPIYCPSFSENKWKYFSVYAFKASAQFLFVYWCVSQRMLVQIIVGLDRFFCVFEYEKQQSFFGFSPKPNLTFVFFKPFLHQTAPMNAAEYSPSRLQAVAAQNTFFWWLMPQSSQCCVIGVFDPSDPYWPVRVPSRPSSSPLASLTTSTAETLPRLGVRLIVKISGSAVFRVVPWFTAALGRTPGSINLVWPKWGMMN